MSNGLSSERLARVTAVLERAIERSEIAGAVSMIFRGGEVAHVDVLGYQDLERALPMRRNTIFRIASMSKPITAVALLILIEESKLGIDDPVEPWLPELAHLKVLRRPDGPLDDVVDICRPVTVRDLASFKLGTGLISPAERTPLAIALRENGIFPERMGLLAIDADEWMSRLGHLPLASQPGERWLYHLGSEILSVLIQRVIGYSLETFLQERVFAPLGMHDTSFHVPAEKLERFSSCYRIDRKTRQLLLHDNAPDSAWSHPPIFESGGAGLVSTADDYLAFGRMLLGNGVLGSTRVLARPSVQLMCTNHLTPAQRADTFFFWPDQWRGRGYGLGVAVGIERDEIWATPGRINWDGAFGTQWATDPKESLVGILMIQTVVAQLETKVCRDFWIAVYQAIDD